MKFANLNIKGYTVEGEDSEVRQINIGDNIQLLAIESLYERMGIPSEQIINLSFNDLYNFKNYEGEYMILPINFFIQPDGIARILLELPEKIIPVYLGLCLSYLNLSEAQLKYLKKFEPIGCRDERTMIFLRQEGIHAYLFGCIAATLSTESNEYENNPAKKVFFVDVPKSLKKHIPENLLYCSEFTQHVYYANMSFLGGENSGKEYIKKRMDQYKNEARLIITSRFHAAILGLAFGIPTIMTLEKDYYKMSWLAKLLPFYTPERFHEIDWEPVSVNFNEIKRLMLKVAVERIQETYDKYSKLLDLSTMLENSNRSDDPNLYYESICKDLMQRWETEYPTQFALWGLGINAEKIYQFIQKNFPQAQLVQAFDSFKQCTFHDVNSEIPTPDIFKKKIFVIVTTTGAYSAAKKIFGEAGKPEEEYYLYDFNFLTKDEL